MNYPTIEQVEAAGHEQLCRWQRFLPSPGSAAIAASTRRSSPLEVARVDKAIGQEVEVMNRIVERVKALGGFTPEISKRIGWTQ